MTEIEIRPHDPMGTAKAIVDAEYEYERNSLGKAMFGNDMGTAEAFTLNELEERQNI